MQGQNSMCFTCTMYTHMRAHTRTHTHTHTRAHTCTPTHVHTCAHLWHTASLSPQDCCSSDQWIFTAGSQHDKGLHKWGNYILCTRHTDMCVCVWTWILPNFKSTFSHAYVFPMHLKLHERLKVGGNDVCVYCLLCVVTPSSNASLNTCVYLRHSLS